MNKINTQGRGEYVTLLIVSQWMLDGVCGCVCEC